MMSLRPFSRSVPRTVSRLSAQSTRASVFRPILLRSACKPASAPRLAAAFSTTRRRYAESGIVDEELVAKLQQEIAMEQEMRDSDNYSGNIKEYLDGSPYKLIDAEGHEEVVLQRTYNDEKIRVTFSIADLNNLENDADSMQEEDPAMQDEDSAEFMEGQSGGANTKGAINQGRTSGGNIKVAPEDSIAPADRPELADEDPNQEPSFPARVNIVVEKKNKGALAIEAVAQDGEMVIDNVYYFQNAALADAKTAEKDWERRGLYTGPPFGNLDEDLQVLMERYLDERDINAHMALFIPDYIDFKEQREYLRWLSNVKAFVES